MTSKQGYKLADGTYSSAYKVGDKFTYTPRFPNPSIGKGSLFELCEGVGAAGSPLLKLIDGYCSYSNAPDGAYGAFIAWEHLSYKQPKQFTKADLQDGMICTNRNGSAYTVRGDRMVREGGHIFLDDIKDDLTVDGWSGDLDIMKVEQPTVLFTRVEQPVKSPAQIELDKLQEQIALLQQQADKLQQTL